MEGGDDEKRQKNLVKIYVGGLPPDIEAKNVEKFFADKDLAGAENILVKKGGYAFLEFDDKAKADTAIAAIDGCDFNGSTLKAEMSLGSDRKSAATSSYKVILSNLPNDTEKDEVEKLVSTFQALDMSKMGDNQTVVVTYQTKEEAEEAVKKLNETEFKSVTLQARLGEKKSPKKTAGQGQNPGQRQIDFPLRILVQSDMVGAIIGRGGQTIRQITQQTRARVDVHRKDSMGSAEKAITIFGQPENCTNACLQIMKVMQEEARNTGKSDDIPLKVLAHNNLIGRIIGKQGGTIKRIMEDNDTKITVSSINDINSFNMERVITIRGDVEQISKAEAEVSSKLRQAYESDLNAMPPPGVIFPALHPAMVPSVGMGLAAINVAQPQVRLPAGNPVVTGQVHHPVGFNGHLKSLPAGQAGGYGLVGDVNNGIANGAATDTTHMYVPNAAVGAIIGPKGSYIRELNMYTGFTIKIAPANEEGAAPYPAAVNQADRRVAITGPSDRFWTPQYCIYEKLKLEGFTDTHDGDVTLTVEIFAPSSHVGRIIGKGGANVRELQRQTGAMIKLPEQLSPPPKEQTSVIIIGKWLQVVTAQQRLRAMIQPAMPAHIGQTVVPAVRPVNGNYNHDEGHTAQ